MQAATRDRRRRVTEYIGRSRYPVGIKLEPHKHDYMVVLNTSATAYRQKCTACPKTLKRIVMTKPKANPLNKLVNYVAEKIAEENPAITIPAQRKPEAASTKTFNTVETSESSGQVVVATKYTRTELTKLPVRELHRLLEVNSIPFKKRDVKSDLIDVLLERGV